jgi:hypothetical protein
MNPLLVAIELARGDPRAGDAGAGSVFCVSTIGSVAGVLADRIPADPYAAIFPPPSSLRSFSRWPPWPP